MNFLITIVVLLFCEQSFAQNFETEKFASSQDSTLYAEIKSRNANFACNQETRDVSVEVANKYQKITGNTELWLLEKPCGDSKNMCPVIYRIRDNKIFCGLVYKIPNRLYDHKQLIQQTPVNKGNCIDDFKNKTDQISWARDYPLFIKNIDSQHKKFLEEERLWWVAREKINPNQSLVDAQIMELKKYHFIFLGGVTAEKQDENYINLNFEPLKVWMTIHGISNEFLVTQYNYPPIDNFKTISNRVLELYKNKKIIFITHSKGSLDLAYYLLSVPSSWNSKGSAIKGWITMQTPFWGTKNAQDCLNNWWLKQLIDAHEYLEDLSDEITEVISPQRAFETWCNADGSSRPEVEALLSSKYLKILNFKTWTERFEKFASQDSGMETLRKNGFDLKGPTDTYIWLPCTDIPGVDYVSFQGFHHWDLTKFENKRLNGDEYYYTVPLMRTLLLQLLQ